MQQEFEQQIDVSISIYKARLAEAEALADAERQKDEASKRARADILSKWAQLDNSLLVTAEIATKRLQSVRFGLVVEDVAQSFAGLPARRVKLTHNDADAGYEMLIELSEDGAQLLSFGAPMGQMPTDDIELPAVTHCDITHYLLAVRKFVDAALADIPLG